MLRLELIREVNHIYLKLFQDATDEAFAVHSLRMSDAHLNQIRAGMQNVNDLGSLIELGKDIFGIIDPIIQDLASKQEKDLILSLDKKLVWVPWELAYTGTSFLCEEFRTGRIVYGNSNAGTAHSRPIQKPYRVLIITNPEGNSVRALDEGKKIYRQIVAGSDVRVDFLPGPIKEAQLTDPSYFTYDVWLYLGDSIYTPGDRSRTGWGLANGEIFSISTVESLIKHSPQLTFPKLIISNNNQRINSNAGMDQFFSQTPPLTLDNYENKAFVSYAWGGESEQIVDELEQAFARRDIRITRDKKDIGYKGSIEAFEERLGRGQSIILVISDRYLRSEHCMHELLEVAENKQFHDRIFPIVLADADIYDPVKRLGYVKHWERKRAELAEAMKTVDPANLQGIREDMDLYDRIRDNVSGLTSILKDMNTLTSIALVANGFLSIINAVEPVITRKKVILQAKEEVQQLLAESFSEDEFRDLCIFRLRYEYNDLEAKGKNGKIRELINVLERRGRIADLIAAVHEMRPNIHFSFEWNEDEAVYSLTDTFLRAGVSHYVDMQQQSGNESTIIASIVEFMGKILSGSSIGEAVQLYLKKTIYEPTRQEWAGCTLYGYPQDNLLTTFSSEIDEHQADIQKNLLSAQISEDKGEWQEAERLYEELRSLVRKDQKNLLQVIEDHLHALREKMVDVQRVAQEIKQNKVSQEAILQQIGPYKLQKKIGIDQYQTLYLAENFNEEIAASTVVIGIPHIQEGSEYADG